MQWSKHILRETLDDPRIHLQERQRHHPRYPSSCCWERLGLKVWPQDPVDFLDYVRTCNYYSMDLNVWTCNFWNRCCQKRKIILLWSVSQCSWYCMCLTKCIQMQVSSMSSTNRFLSNVRSRWRTMKNLIERIEIAQSCVPRWRPVHLRSRYSN